MKTSAIKFLFAAVALIATAFASTADTQTSRWSEQKTQEWYARQPWLVGANYIPRSAINQLEMWQQATFNPEQIDQELTWAEGLGMNTMRVFLHDLLWQQDAPGLQRRIDQFLTIAARHHIRPLFVLFDSCWDPLPHLGPQHPPIPGIHNSGWVQSPGAAALTDESQYPRLKSYVQGIVGEDKVARVAVLLPQVFQWAREMNPIQPLTSGVWEVDKSLDETKLGTLQEIQLRESDIISFHNYSWPEYFKREVAWLKKYNRPVICTEYMARSAGSTFDTILPIAKQERVGAINWGFVAGKTQTYFPWDSWRHPYVLDQPSVWFHEILLPDGTPYRQAEVDLIRQLTAKQ
ncbi:MAG: 1,4-beta-xylanase [Acidobacteria bacterium]|nr:MAG: 1,4-beta-xylanase [Acidobacteriota bacterium]